MNKKNGLSERIRTSGLVNPIHARYQTVLHPDIEDYYSGFHEKIQEEISIFNKKTRKLSKKLKIVVPSRFLAFVALFGEQDKALLIQIKTFIFINRLIFFIR